MAFLTAVCRLPPVQILRVPERYFEEKLLGCSRRKSARFNKLGYMAKQQQFVWIEKWSCVESRARKDASAALQVGSVLRFAS